MSSTAVRWSVSRRGKHVVPAVAFDHTGPFKNFHILANIFVIPLNEYSQGPDRERAIGMQHLQKRGAEGGVSACVPPSSGPWLPVSLSSAAHTPGKTSREHASGCCNYGTVYTEQSHRRDKLSIRLANVFRSAGTLPLRFCVR